MVEQLQKDQEAREADDERAADTLMQMVLNKSHQGASEAFKATLREMRVKLLAAIDNELRV
jgi:hypothetical protein